MAVAAAAGERFDPAAPSPSRAPGASRQDVQAAIAKAVELRQLHAALLQRGAPNARAGATRSPAVIRLPPAASPARSRTADEEYPVFTPAYDDDEESVAAAALSHICQDNRSRSENWAGVGVDDAALSDYDGLHAFSSSNSEVLFPSSTTDPARLRNRGAAAAYKIHPAFMHSADRFLSSAGRAGYHHHTSELKLPPATCNNAIRPATIGRAAPPSAAAKSRAPQILSWLFLKSRKKAKLPAPAPEMSSSAPADVSRLLTEWGALSALESLKKELADATAHRDAALREAAEVRSTLGELAAKLASVEAYCAELKKALRQATTSPSAVSRRSTRSAASPMPVSHDVMVEGFLQIASESRLSVKQLCKALIQQVNNNEDASDGLSDKLDLLLRPHQLTLTGGNGNKHCSRAVLYHLEAIMNQAMYQDFENPAFQRGGSARCLEPGEERRRSFAAFVALRNLSWNEVLRKGTKYYSEDFSRFCDRKMSAVVATLGWSRPWPEQLLQCFFVAAKCVWLLHLLAFSFGPPLTILRVEGGRAFDEMYMEDILQDSRQQVRSPCQVKIMVMPGFYVQDRVLKCRVLTTRSAA
ncbi:unnamed protein product [Urochloa decumbens]|uniref:GIL1/IRKI C-terminal domain-containing protein n=1 Tax=Urochloa decumbens TaxID=240449 RepID=A0ABC9FDM0_9POAL